MADPDIDVEMTAEEYEAMYGGGPTDLGTIGLPKDYDTEMTAEQYKATYGKDWNITDSGKNFAAGAVEGVTGLLGLAADLNPMQFGGPQLDFPTSKMIERFQSPILPIKDPKYRYARTIGSFVGPGGIFKPLTKGKAIATAITDVLGALGAQGAEDITGDKKIAPIFGAIGGSGAASLFRNTGSALRALFRGASQEEIKGSAAAVFRELSGLTGKDLDTAIASLPDDELARLMSTAEVTNNAGVAQIEKTLSASDEAARLYDLKAKLRNAARDRIINAGSTTQGVNKEGVGVNLITKAKEVQEQMAAGAKTLWRKVPRQSQIDVREGQNALGSLLGQRQAGLPLDRRVQVLIDQFMATDPKSPALSSTRTSGALQDIRSDTLDLLRSGNLTANEDRLLSALQSQIDEAMGKSLKGEDFAAWKLAREATATKAQTFARGTAGGSLSEPMARPSNVLVNALKGDRKSVKELKAAIGNDPKLLEDVKRAFIDTIPRDAQGNLTPNKMKNFLSANEGTIKELFGEDYLTSMKRILSDLQSESNVAQSAFRSSKGNSVTAQRATVAGMIHDTMLGALIPGSGTLSRLADMVKKAVNVKDAQGVQELLFRAAMNPKFAKELAEHPSNTRIFSALDRLYNAGKDLGVTASKTSVQELSRNQDNRKGKVIIRGGGVKKVPSKYQKTAESLQSAVIKQESGGKTDAVSKVGAKGLMQLMDATGREWHKKLGIKEPYNPNNPEQNKKIGTAYLAWLLEQFNGDKELALTAYNQGIGRVKALLEKTGGSRLSDIVDQLGPDGKKYAKLILGNFKV